MAGPGGSVSRKGKRLVRRVAQAKEGSLDKQQSRNAEQGSQERAAVHPANHSSTGRAIDTSARKIAEKKSPRGFTYQSFSKVQKLDDSPGQLKEFLTATLAAVTSSEVSRQEAINYLATENGLARVQQIVETNFSARYSVTTPMFNPHCLLFLRLITHKDVLQSLAVEKAVGTIYNVIYGLNGKRAIPFFQSFMNWLEETQVESENGGQGDASSHMESSLLVSKALLHVLTVNQGAAIRTEFKALLESLSIHYIPSSLNAHGLEGEGLREVYENINKIADILDMGDRISSVRPSKKIPAPGTQHQDRADFVLLVDFPGDLSEFGPRHDNDHAAIENIRLLPTLDEICSQRKDFLPSRDAYMSPNGHHQEGIFRLIDSQFRLLREDTAGVLRDAVRMIAEHWTTITQDVNWGLKRKLIRYESPTPMRIYYGAQLQQFRASSVKGLEMDVEFDQLRMIRRMSPEQRKKHWINSRGLKEGGGLVALVDAEVESDMNAVFLQVSKREIDPALNKSSETVRDLVSNAERAMVTLRFPSIPTERDIASLISMSNAQHHVSRRPLILVEFPAVQYNQFEGVLRCLQALHENPSRIPFTRHLTIGAGGKYSLPTRNDINFASSSARNPIPPPRYLRHSILDLSSIKTEELDDSAGESAAPLILSPQEDVRGLCQRLCELSALDSGQVQAMVSALTHEIALIQGPPGTGKSYVGIEIAKCLLRNKEHLGLGPLLCVCYTNHALDQFLNELANSGITRILRIGSRSPSDLMESFSLDTYKKSGKIPRLIGHGRRIQDSKNMLETQAAEIGIICRELGESSSSIVAMVLKRQFPAYETLIREGSSESCECIKAWVNGDGPGDMENNGTERSIDQLFSVGPWTLTNKERSRIYHYCYELGIKDKSKRLHGLIREHATKKQHYTSLFTQSDAQIFDQVDVVGVTTTGLANNSDLLRTMQAKVLICEEAGEVLESHLLTALLPSVEHAILIGDHLQLRPRISRLHLSMEYDGRGPKYNLDESLFERLAKMRLPSPGNNPHTEEVETCEFPVAQLDHQRRMHPCISSLIRQNLYPKLKDHHNTASYPEIAGIKRRLFWLDHENDEDPSDPEDPMRSKTNTWEAEMVTALARHLCRQGKYKRGDIAILTPYVGQLRIIKDMLESVADLIISDNDLAELGELEDDTDVKRKPVQKGSLSDQLRIATVDNFQGEEAIVVIISLVRSNKYRNCGFLKTSNRINVLLSRDVLERRVELILLQQYADIDVDKDPVIFLSCGHFYTRSTMDETMGLKNYYDIDPVTEDILQPKPSWRAVTSSSPPGCPECRRSLRDVHRYNRIVKKALLDEATRRFVSKAHRDYIALIEAIQAYEEILESERSKFVEKWLTSNVEEPTFIEVKTVDTYDGKDDKIKKKVKQFIKSVSKIEQPFGRVNALLASAIARDEGFASSSFQVEEAAIQTGFHIRGDCLHLRLSWAIQLGNHKICQNVAVNSNIRSMFRNRVDNQLPELLEKCRAVQKETFFQQYCFDETDSYNPSPTAALNEIQQTLADCEDLYNAHQGTLAHLKSDIENTKIFCNGGTFYSFVTTEEKRQVYEAMAAQFQGTGHWYYCLNNHPFIVGECGMPMEEARCPQCGERVGGHDHMAVPGVRRAEDFDAEFGWAQD